MIAQLMLFQNILNFNDMVEIEKNIQMVDLKGQYLKIQEEIDHEVIRCIRSAAFINGPDVSQFENNFAEYLKVEHVIGCANGTDALQIALMALDLEPGDEVIVPAFTYVATAEVIALLRLKPVMVDVDPDTFNIKIEGLEKYITTKTKVIVPVHLYGQSADMETLMALAEKHNLYVIEDNAQAIGGEYFFKNGQRKKNGTIGHIGCTSFFPSKNLGCYGDGGALMTNDPKLAEKIKMIANHGQKKKYYHAVIGINSRLDTLQAAILNVKLKYIEEYISARQKCAQTYDKLLGGLSNIEIPVRSQSSDHVFHQYTIKVKGGKRDMLQRTLKEHNIPSMIYYPLPLYKQEAFAIFHNGEPFQITEQLCTEVLSLPIHTEMQDDTLQYICDVIKKATHAE
jgi:UDP-2-acetamido-2-deoxy-ribo-hexuluronate aminotransferase